MVELYVTLQEEWGVPLDDSAATAELTVDEVAESVAGLLAANGTPGDAAR
ncbi:Acyl carrier protein OS=Streptomyces microflavus OX=1919 GN=Smic_25880 PE=4 SV=1 [Streptomyces microflavus]